MKGVVLVLLLLPLAASAATITVNNTADNTTAGNGQCTLREAIANVNAAADTTSGDCTAGSGAGDTIKFGFAVPAKIRLQLGQLPIQRDVNILNQAPGSLRIDGAGMSRIFEIVAGTTRLLGLTIQRGKAGNGGGVLVDPGARLNLTSCLLIRNTATGSVYYEDEGFGGAIHNNGGNVALTNCTFDRNTAPHGGGAAIGNVEGGTLTLAACRLLRNRAASPTGYDGDGQLIRGGALYNDGAQATVNDCLFSRNRATTGGDSIGLGGAIYNEGSMTVAGCTFTHNVVAALEVSEAAGGAIQNNGSLAIADSTFVGNLAVARGADSSYYTFGGAIANGDFVDSGGLGQMIMTNCAVVRNVALTRQRTPQRGYGYAAAGYCPQGVSWGGGIYNGGAATLIDTTLGLNHANADKVCYGNDASGGGIYNEGDLTLVNCTLSGNTAHRPKPYPDYGGGGGALAGDQGIVITNTIVANSGVAGNCAGAAVTSGGHNLSSDDTCFTGGTDLLHTAPHLAPLANNGGPTQTMALCTAPGRPDGCRAASRAIDAGDDAVTSPPQNLGSDQRGLPRRRGAHVDIGAYEVQ